MFFRAVLNSSLMSAVPPMQLGKSRHFSLIRRECQLPARLVTSQDEGRQVRAYSINCR